MDVTNEGRGSAPPSLAQDWHRSGAIDAATPSVSPIIYHISSYIRDQAQESGSSSGMVRLKWAHPENMCSSRLALVKLSHIPNTSTKTHQP